MVAIPGQQTSPDHDPVVQGTQSQRTLLCLTTIVSGSKCPLEPPNSRKRSDSWRFPSKASKWNLVIITTKRRWWRKKSSRLPPFHQDFTYFYRLGATILVGGFTASQTSLGRWGSSFHIAMQNMKPPGFLMSWTVSLALETRWFFFPSRNPWFTATYHNLHHEGSR